VIEFNSPAYDTLTSTGERLGKVSLFILAITKCEKRERERQKEASHFFEGENKSRVMGRFGGLIGYSWML